MRSCRSSASAQWREASAMLVIGLALLFTPASRGIFARPQAVPVERLVKQGESYLRLHPADAEAHYTLARIHYLAFRMESGYSLAYQSPLAKEDGMPSLGPRWMDKDALIDSAKFPLMPDSEIFTAMACQAELAMIRFEEAIKLSPDNALYQLGKASLIEEFLQWRDRKGPVVGEWPAALAGLDFKRCRAAYAKAFTLAMVTDSKLTQLPDGDQLQGITAYEAAESLTRLAQRKKETLSEADQEMLLQAKEAMMAFGKLKPNSVVTPIVFSMRPVGHLAELLQPAVTVDFDLRGYGLTGERWPWVKPELGFLVWDPEQTGRITSARQLFGGYTFQIFRKDGYAALAALDDDGDGQLAGAELAGIRVWFDGNGDGVSTPEEVQSLSELGIAAIATQAEGRDGMHLTNIAGVRLKNGRTLRTWDWMVEPAREVVVVSEAGLQTEN